MLISDILIFFANILLCVSLFPSVMSENKPDKKTDIIEIVVCILFMFAYSMLHLYLAVVVNIFILIVWTVLLVQSIKKEKSPIKWKKPFDLEMIDDDMDLLDGID